MHIKSLPLKAPGEIIPVVFDFEKLTDTIDSVVISVSVKNGVDASPSNLILGGTQIVGSEARQLIQAGLDDVSYLIRADVTAAGGVKYALAAYLTVKELS